MRITPEKFAAVSSLPAEKRYAYFIKVAADQNSVYALHSGGWALMATDHGAEAFPVWPAAAYAEACAQGEWAGFVPCRISLETFLGELLPSLRKTNTGLGVFPTPSGKCITPALDQLEADLRYELSKVE